MGNIWATNFIESFFKSILLYIHERWKVGCQKSVHYIHMLWTGCFILNGIVNERVQTWLNSFKSSVTWLLNHIWNFFKGQLLLSSMPISGFWLVPLGWMWLCWPITRREFGATWSIGLPFVSENRSSKMHRHPRCGISWPRSGGEKLHLWIRRLCFDLSSGNLLWRSFFTRLISSSSMLRF